MHKKWLQKELQSKKTTANNTKAQRRGRRVKNLDEYIIEKSYELAGISCSTELGAQTHAYALVVRVRS